MQSKTMVIILFVVILVLGGGLFLFTRNNTTNNNPTPTTTPTPTPTLTTTPSEESQTFTLTAQNNSGQDGSAVLEEVGSQVRVTISISNPVLSNPQPAHIHVGSCPNPGAVEFPLTNVIDGKSVTMLDTTFAELNSMEPLAINIHKSPSESSVYFSCGNLDIQ